MDKKLRALDRSVVPVVTIHEVVSMPSGLNPSRFIPNDFISSGFIPSGFSAQWPYYPTLGIPDRLCSVYDCIQLYSALHSLTKST
jgi:hypothetical protein